MGKCVGAPHPNTLPYISPMPTHFPTHAIHFPTPLPTHLSLLIPTPQHTSPQLPYLFPQLPSPPPTYTLTHFPTHPMHSPTPLPHSLDYVAKLPCDDVQIKNQIKSSLYSPYYAEACNEWRGPSLQLSAWATQLRRNVATVASHWRHCADLTGLGIEPQTSHTDSTRLATELTAGPVMMLS